VKKKEYPRNTGKILRWFEEISKIPRQSKHERKICQRLLNWAKENDLAAQIDQIGNIVIHVPATKGYEDAPTIILQAHVDMVCEKLFDSTHDFSNDPIELIYEENILRANNTTLGADNGIGVAFALSIALDQKIDHPDLELLLTVEEESGLKGAISLDETLIKGDLLINLDAGDEKTFVIGCSGGANIRITLPLKLVALNNDEWEPYILKTDGIKGGHSGVDIHLQRANAIKELISALDFCMDTLDFRIAYLKGGSATNAIPRYIETTLFIKQGEINLFRKEMKKIEAIIQREYRNTDPNISLILEENKAFSSLQAMSKESNRKIIKTILALPDGVESMSKTINGLVDTSNNLATAAIENDRLVVLTSLRSSSSRLIAFQNQITSIVELIGGRYLLLDEYPGWEANLDSPLLKICKDVYRNLFLEDPVIEIIHAGLECGIIGRKRPGIDMISLGPKIRNEHSPSECIYIDTIEHTWNLIVGVLAKIQ